MARSDALPDRNHAEAGARLAAANARRLLDGARAVADQTRSFGLASSLCVLAGEEAVKALVLLAWAGDLPLPTEEHLRLILRGHDARYVAAAGLVGFVETIGAIFAAFAGAMTKSQSQSQTGKRMPSQLSQAAFWAGAGDLKNRGLYVGFVRNGWLDPSDLNEQAFDQAEQYASRLVEVVGSMADEGSKSVVDAAQLLE